MSTILSSSSSSVPSSTLSTSTGSQSVIRVTISHEGNEVSTVHIQKNLHDPSPVEVIDDTPYSYNYTGRHDGGPLPPIPTHNIYGHIIEAIKEAKLTVDKEIQKLIPPRPTVHENEGQTSTKTIRKNKDQGPNKKKQRQQQPQSSSSSSTTDTMMNDEEGDDGNGNDENDDDDDDDADDSINNDE